MSEMKWPNRGGGGYFRTKKDGSIGPGFGVERFPGEPDSIEMRAAADAEHYGAGPIKDDPELCSALLLALESDVARLTPEVRDQLRHLVELGRERVAQARLVYIEAGVRPPHSVSVASFKAALKRLANTSKPPAGK
jgi:hypothetical protein